MAPPERSAHLQKASVLPPALTVSSSHARMNREPEITAKADASREDEDSSDSSESSESDSGSKRTKRRDGSDDSDSSSGLESNSDHHGVAPSVCIGPPQFKQKLAKSVHHVQGCIFFGEIFSKYSDFWKHNI